MGVCDPATKSCWRTREVDDVVLELKDILRMFLAKDSLNDFVHFTSWNDPAATLAVSGPPPAACHHSMHACILLGRCCRCLCKLSFGSKTC